MSEHLLYLVQQLLNGLTIGSTYALIAIGYTMVYGIIGMINFAHGEVYMIGSYVAFMVMAGLMMMGIDDSSIARLPWLWPPNNSSRQCSRPLTRMTTPTGSVRSASTSWPTSPSRSP